jgi:hypothetical protein
MEKEGYVKLKQMSKGVDAITEVDRSHKESVIFLETLSE